MGNNDSSFTDIPAQNILSSQTEYFNFQHQDLLTASDAEKPWKQEKLVNKLNHLNFIDGFIFLIISNNNNFYLLKAFPLPCLKDELLCRLTPPGVINKIPNYNFDFIMINDGLTAVLAPIQLISAENDIIKLSLPAHSHVKKMRKTRRHKCEDIDCQVIQNDFKADGTLIDFTPTAMSVRLSIDSSAASFDFNNPLELTLSNKGDILYSGPCSCIRNGINSYDGKIVLAPLVNHIERFPKRKMRNPRQRITPSFSIIFKHPLFFKNIERDIFDISTSGFSVHDNIEKEILLPGMIIPNICIVYAGVLKMDCSARVLYRHPNKNNSVAQCGLVITDMDVKSFSLFNHILAVHFDNNNCVSTEVAMDDLWEFFFDTGFIYGEKYQYLNLFSETFKDTYQKLYQENPNIARHFIYKKNGVIYGHMSMVHAYNPSWLIHHFAARHMDDKIAGLMVLKQIIHYINGYYRLSSGGMDYVMAYYQPNNEAMHLIFGGFVDYLKNIKGSSLDLYSYITLPHTALKQNLPSDYLLRECTLNDIKTLKDFYQNTSGGLMIDALGLGTPLTQLRQYYAQAGFIRNFQIFCLLFKDKQEAFFIVNKSDLGLNLSDLLNGITIFIINNELKWTTLLAAINQLNFYYKDGHIPLLIYPHNYSNRQNINASKYYQQWIIKNDPYVEDFVEYMASKFRMKYYR